MILRTRCVHELRVRHAMNGSVILRGWLVLPEECVFLSLRSRRRSFDLVSSVVGACIDRFTRWFYR